MCCTLADLSVASRILFLSSKFKEIRRYVMSNQAALHLIHPDSESVKAKKLKGGRRTNEDMGRSREHLTLTEVRRLMKAAKSTGRVSLQKRNYLAVLMMYRHGLRVSELVGMRWSDVDLSGGSLFVHRAKGSNSGAHHLEYDEIRGLAALRQRQPDVAFVFTGASGSPLTTTAVRDLLERLGREADFPFRVHPHQLRHACGFDLVDQGLDLRRVQAWLGHKDIANTVRYAALSGSALKSIKTRV
jgi:integrase